MDKWVVFYEKCELVGVFRFFNVWNCLQLFELESQLQGKYRDKSNSIELTRV
jgi:hypothetical protein